MRFLTGVIFVSLTAISPALALDLPDLLQARKRSPRPASMICLPAKESDRGPILFVLPLLPKNGIRNPGRRLWELGFGKGCLDAN